MRRIRRELARLIHGPVHERLTGVAHAFDVAYEAERAGRGTYRQFRSMNRACRKQFRQSSGETVLIASAMLSQS